MKITVRNLGVLKQAGFELGDLTIICGKNNTGKTYATYALHGFLDYFAGMPIIPIEDTVYTQLVESGSVIVDLREYIDKAAAIVAETCRQFKQHLPQVFAAMNGSFDDAQFSINLNGEDVKPKKSFGETLRSGRQTSFQIAKEETSDSLTISLLSKERDVTVPASQFTRAISDAIKEIVFASTFPRTFIISTERTGVSMFSNILTPTKAHFFEWARNQGLQLDPMTPFYAPFGYSWSVEQNIFFTRGFKSLSQQKSVIATEHPDILDALSTIVGGVYTVRDNNGDDSPYYLPTGTKSILSMNESSSSVRALLLLDAYLRHVAKPGDILIVDEPELNLHPENQRRIVRLFARLVNIGIKVLITTHSDYIIKELNTLIMLHADPSATKGIMSRYGYTKAELLSPERVCAYYAGKGLIQLPENKRRTRAFTLTPCDINPRLGIEVKHFDESIVEMNQIQEDILFGVD